MGVSLDSSRADFRTVASVQELVERGREQYPDIYKRWCEIGKKLADWRGDTQGHAYEHLDANIDLVLRSLETEQLAAIAKFGRKFEGGVLFAQISLSKMWLFSIYEIVRQSCEAECKNLPKDGRFCGDPNCYRCQGVEPVRDRLNCFRIPLAKLEPERTKRMANYHAEIVIDEDSGSVGWRTLSGRSLSQEVTSRLALSDYVIRTLS